MNKKEAWANLIAFYEEMANRALPYENHDEVITKYKALERLGCQMLIDLISRIHNLPEFANVEPRVRMGPLGLHRTGDDKDICIGVPEKGVFQVGVYDHRTGTEMPQLAFTGRQSARNLAQGARSAQMAKLHRHKLAPAGHALGMLLALVARHGLAEQTARDNSDNLAENAGYSLHGWVDPPAELVLNNSTLPESAHPPPRNTSLRWHSNVLDRSANQQGLAGDSPKIVE